MKYPIFNQTENVTVTMVDPNILQGVEITRDSERNKAITKYHFTLHTLEETQSGDKFLIQFPGEISLRAN